MHARRLDRPDPKTLNANLTSHLGLYDTINSRTLLDHLELLIHGTATLLSFLHIEFLGVQLLAKLYYSAYR